MFTVENVLNLIQQYGAIIIFICLFFGIVGIPAPEETLLFIIGIFIHSQKLNGMTSVMGALLGAYLGMVVAYCIGRYAGAPVFQKVVKQLKLNTFQAQAWQEKYQSNYKKALVIGFFIPGARQMNPYIAGLSHIPVLSFLFYSFIGTLLWTVPFITLGYMSGNLFHIPYKYLPLIGLGIALLFGIYYLLKKKILIRKRT
ncbi:DedA family protein [Solibacillus sp. R5-41]|uniref:DedA family protein n=1 Tax=Solibacillus sp. R5-41 TaxID=2048654 RepID=UPI0012FD21B8|nr:DedA family protein [Solibacillus sp. R5-41]